LLTVIWAVWCTWEVLNAVKKGIATSAERVSEIATNTASSILAVKVANMLASMSWGMLEVNAQMPSKMEPETWTTTLSNAVGGVNRQCWYDFGTAWCSLLMHWVLKSSIM